MATIRPAAASDTSSLFELVRTFPTATPPSSEQFSKALDAKLSDASSCLLVAEHERRLFRGTGIGRQLMDAFEQWAKDRRSVLVSLATRGAAAFYEHRGYTSKAGYYKKYVGTDSPQ